MWQLFFLVVWLLIRSYDCEVSVIGNNVTLECPGTTSTARIIKLLWEYANGTRVFYCEKNECENNTTRHALSKKDKFISFLTIHNVSLDDEAEYGFKMFAFGGLREDCKRNLTITVPPIGLELVDADGNELLQNNGSLKIAEGEKKTIVCKTNAPTKPAVDLQWKIPEGLNVSAKSSINVQDDADGRLYVSMLTLNFTLNVYDGDIVLVCRVASTSSIDEIRASIYIKNESEITTYRGNIRTASTDSRTLAATNEYTKSGTRHMPSFDTTTSALDVDQHLLAKAGGSGVAMLLIVLAFVGGFIRSKNRAVRRSVPAESTELRPPQGRRALPPTPSDQSSLPANHLPNQPPPTAQLFRPVPSHPPDIPMRPLVPVSEDAIRRTAERTGSRETFTTTDGSSPVTQAQKESDTETEYDLLNISHHGAPGAVPHVYRETTNGLAEYALVSRQQVDKRIDQRQRHRSKQMEDDSDYDLLNTWNQAEHGTVPHVYKETTSGLAEYAVVSKPDDKKKRQSLGPLTKVMKAPINVEAEYAVVDKSKKRAK